MNKEKLCIYCGENKAMTKIFNPNMDEDEDFWDVCLTCAEVIKEQQKLDMGEIIKSRPHGKEFGEKLIREATQRLKEINNRKKMTDYYPNIRTIIAIFYFAFWYFKEARPFSIWWLILIYAIDYIIEIFVAYAILKINKKAFSRT
jgi:hypothetical protein